MSETEHNCPFYGAELTFLFHLDQISRIAAVKDNPHALRFRPESPPFTLINFHGGNKCAYKMDRQAPCQEEMEGRPIDWRTCPLWRNLQPQSVVDVGQ